MSPPSLVALRALGLGDFLTGVPAFRALARAFPEHRRLLAAPRALHVLVPLLGDAFSGALAAEALGALPEEAGGAAVAVDLHGRGPQSHRALIAARPERLIAFAHPEIAESAGGPQWRAGEREVTRWCRLLRHAGIAANEAELALAVPQYTVPPAFCGVTVVHAGAASASRRWPLERFAAVALRCVAAGERVVLTGSALERPRTTELARLAGLAARQNIAGRTSLLELAAIVARAARVLCGDTGVAHLASAYRVPSVVLFGPVSPQEWGPPPSALHRVLWAGRHGDPHAASVDSGLLEITIDDVVAELDRIRTLRPTAIRE